MSPVSELIKYGWKIFGNCHEKFRCVGIVLRLRNCVLLLFLTPLYSWYSQFFHRKLHNLASKVLLFLKISEVWSERRDFNWYLLTCQANSAFLGKIFLHWAAATLEGLGEFRIKNSRPLFTINFKSKMSTSRLKILVKDSYRNGRNTPHWFSKIWNQ